MDPTVKPTVTTKDGSPKEPAARVAARPDEKQAALYAAEERWERTKSNVKTIVGAVALAVFIRIVLFEAFEIDGPSMEPSLLHGDRVVVAKYPFGLFLPFTNDAIASWGMPEVGDIVIVRSPADDVDIVKRVIGVPGDTVEIRDDVVYRNGEQIHRRVVGPCHDEEQVQPSIDCQIIEEGVGELRWRTSADEHYLPESMPPQTVPPGHIFVLGDHRDHSNDSRNPRVGMIPIQRVKGRVMAIYWSSYLDIRWDRMFHAVE